MSKTLLVYGSKTFKITVPDDARITFGPWSPPGMGGKNDPYGSPKALSGTLRIYSGGPKSTESVLAVFSGVEGYRDMSIDYSEQVAVEEGATMWKSDQDGYHREEKVTGDRQWVDGRVLLGDTSRKPAPRRRGPNKAKPVADVAPDETVDPAEGAIAF